MGRRYPHAGTQPSTTSAGWSSPRSRSSAGKRRARPSSPSRWRRWHGHLVESTDLTASLDWPGLQQVFRLERTWREHGVTTQAVLYGSTSLTPYTGAPARARAKMGTLAIENRLHRVKDATLEEDRSALHAGQGPTVMVFLRDAALSLLRCAGVHQVTARLRERAQNPAPAVALVIAPSPAATRTYALGRGPGTADGTDEHG